MPSGNRLRVTVEGNKFDLSPIQYEMLRKSSSISVDKKDWNYVQRVKGLAKQGLLKKQNGKFTRTKIAISVLAVLKSRNGK